MVFSSLLFVFAFLSISMGIYLCVPKRYQNTVLLVSSLIFYSWGGPMYLLLLLGETAISWVCALRIGNLKSKKKKKFWMTVECVALLGLLAIFKYTGFIGSTMQALTGFPEHVAQIVLPIGISFYTFQLLSYVIDVYRGEVKAQRNYARLLLYSSLFHQCIAGPIVRYKTVADEITTLEDYLRKTENADHMSWNDLDLNRRKTGIVKKIRTNLINKISSHYKEAVQATDRRQNLSLGKIIGSKILPAEGSGYWDDRGGGSSGPGGTGGDGDTSTPDIQGTMGTVTGFKMSVCGAVEYRGSQVCIPVQLSFGKRDQGILSVAVQTEAGRRTADYWAKNVGTLYPVWIDALEINRIEKGRKKFRNTHAEPEAGSVESMAEIHNSTVFQNIEFEFEKGNGGPGCHSVRIQVPEADHYRLFCAVVVSVSDLEAVLDFKKVTDPGKKEAEK